MPLEQSLNDFGTEGYVQGLEWFINNADSPITIALQGEWGSGKTSLMNQLYNDLCKADIKEKNDDNKKKNVDDKKENVDDKKEFIGIKINTWEQAMLSTPEGTVIKIIEQLIYALTDNDEKAKSKVKRWIKGAANIGYRLGREVTKVAMSQPAGILIEGFVPNNLPISLGGEENTVSLAELRVTLSEAIKKKKEETKTKGILIFVDDLDRLNPPLAVQILELLKNIFTLDDCIFVLAIDYDVVVKGLEPKFGKFSPENEREFRSFFDKIIQVPFSLPVNSYRPMGFVLNSLVKIGYIESADRNLPFIKENIEKVVNCSVGNNPRSIKRLINTLSLHGCIDRYVAEKNREVKLWDKIINIAIVALQICYPKIYDMLRENHDFKKWDKSIAAKLNLKLDEGNNKVINGETILEALCEKDTYINKRHDELLELIETINYNAQKINEREPLQVIKQYLDRSSSTNVSIATKEEDFDRKSLISMLHSNVWEYISKKRPDIPNPQPKRNTGNGGYFIFFPDGVNKHGNNYFEVIFQPMQTDKNIALKINLDVWNKRPEKLKEASYDEVINDAEVREAIKPLANVVEELSGYGIIEGCSYDGNIFKNLYDEYKYREGEMWNSMAHWAAYWIKQPVSSDFEGSRIIGAIGDLIIGAYDMNIKAISLHKNQ